MLLERLGIVPGVALAATGCTACTGSSATISSDAGPDAATVHHVRDAGDDAYDAGSYTEAGPVEAGAPFSSGSWSTIPNITCNEYLSLTPGTSVSRLNWVTCASKRAGCQALKVDWAAPYDRPIVFSLYEPIRLVGGMPYVFDVRVFSNNAYNPTAEILVVETLDGGRVFAMGNDMTPGSCVDSLAVGEHGIVGRLVLAKDIPHQFFAWSLWSTPQAISILPETTSAYGAAESQLFSVGASRVFLEARSPNSVVSFTPEQGSVTKTTPTLSAEDPIAVSDGAIAFDLSGPFSLDLVRPDGTWTNLIAAASPHQVTAFAIDRANAQQIVWVESDDLGGLYGNSVLWTSPYATSAASIVRTKVAAFNDRGGGGDGMVANAGVALFLMTDTQARLTRLSDGLSWQLDAEPGKTFTQALWADDNEVWLATGTAGDPSWFIERQSILRLSRASLGAPTIPRGF